MKVSLISKIFTAVLYVLFVAGIVGIAGIVTYMLMNRTDFFNWYNFISNEIIFLHFFIVLVGGLIVWMMGEVIGAMRTLKTNPFTRRNVNAVTRIGIIMILIFIAFSIKCILFFTVLSFIFTVMLGAACLAVFTLQNLFSQAIFYKEENELTI